jgi:hypothetical protein
MTDQIFPNERFVSEWAFIIVIFDILGEEDGSTS